MFVTGYSHPGWAQGCFFVASPSFPLPDTSCQGCAKSIGSSQLFYSREAKPCPSQQLYLVVAWDANFDVCQRVVEPTMTTANNKESCHCKIDCRRNVYALSKMDEKRPLRCLCITPLIQINVIGKIHHMSYTFTI